MKRRVILLVALVLGALAIAGASGARGATPEPELGLTIQSRTFISEGGGLVLWNRSNVPTSVELVPADGWTVTPTTLDLAPDEQATVYVSGEGEDAAAILVRATAAQRAAANAQRAYIELASKVYRERPASGADLWVVASLVALAITVALGAFYVALRRRPTYRKEAP